jgi:hypothetical protein
VTASSAGRRRRSTADRSGREKARVNAVDSAKVARSSSALFLAILVSSSCASSPSPAASPAAVVSTATPTATPSAAPTAVPSPTAASTPSPSLTLTQAPNPATFTLSGNVTSSTTGQPMRAAVNVFRPSAGFCATWASNPALAPVAGTTVSGNYVLRGIPPGTYLIVVSPREAPFGNWWWNGKTTCESADQLNLASDTVANFAIPPR